MWAFAIVVVAVAVTLSFTGFTPLVVPIALVAGAVAAVVVVRQRRAGEAQVMEFREQGRKASGDASDVEFTERDGTTQYRP